MLLNASNMWFYDPASKASIRISAQQRLIGQASDGDVLTVNLAHDYAAQLSEKRSSRTPTSRPRSAWHLDLTASTSDAAYSRLETWIERGTYQPIKSQVLLG